jgi:hypothetical protein
LRLSCFLCPVMGRVSIVIGTGPKPYLMTINDSPHVDINPIFTYAQKKE